MPFPASHPPFLHATADFVRQGATRPAKRRGKKNFGAFLSGFYEFLSAFCAILREIRVLDRHELRGRRRS